MLIISNKSTGVKWDILIKELEKVDGDGGESYIVDSIVKVHANGQAWEAIHCVQEEVDGHEKVTFENADGDVYLGLFTKLTTMPKQQSS